MLEGVAKASIEAVCQALREAHEEIVSESPQSGDFTTYEPEEELAEPSSTAICEFSAQPSPAKHSQHNTMPQAAKSGATVWDEKDEEAAASFRTILNRYVRSKIRHQVKKRNKQWHVPRSRKRRDLAKCVITISGIAIYYAKTVKAVQFKNLFISPEV
ncbi:hypothetical protein PC115_g16314 [Phytophthora cactorum]|uniref:Uncharacterized protein n=2 Tax=Phytophthora cactorum TaxID=29920 RepID=A0A8T1BHB6_9STRA|nr:hypothetical protein PC115_g16314 [Phytophthora cactorum]